MKTKQYCLMRYFLIIVAVLAVAAVVYQLFIAQKPQAQIDPMQKIADSCVKDAKGTWLSEFKECEYPSKQWCDANGGTFNECESACRHNSDPLAPCTMQCVIVCKF